VALVTGASGGIGRAVAHALAAHGMSVCLTGRDADRLQATAREIAPHAAQALAHAGDLGSDEAIRGLAAQVFDALGRLDVLVHAAGALRLGDAAAAGWDDLDRQYEVNVRAPFLLTKALLPLLEESRGQVVFVNSTAALAGGRDNVTYAATKQALRALADGLRDRVNPCGVRVTSVFPGRTATPMQERVHAFEGRPYDESALLCASDVAEAIVAALVMPRSAEVTDVVIRPMNTPSSRRSGS